MRELPLEKIWTGDGLGNSNAVTLKQVKRTPTVALYQRFKKDGTPQGYEVFLVRKVEAGTPLPGGGQVEETYERYPTANQFGRIAWAPSSLASAERMFDNLCQGLNPYGVKEKVAVEPSEETESDDETPASVPVVKVQKAPVNLNLPDGEFSVRELAEQNGVEYVTAYLFVKAMTAENKVNPTRSERRAARGKATQLYSKVS